MNLLRSEWLTFNNEKFTQINSLSIGKFTRHKISNNNKKTLKINNHENFIFYPTYLR